MSKNVSPIDKRVYIDDEGVIHNDIPKKPEKPKDLVCYLYLNPRTNAIHGFNDSSSRLSYRHYQKPKNWLDAIRLFPTNFKNAWKNYILIEYLLKYPEFVVSPEYKSSKNAKGYRVVWVNKDEFPSIFTTLFRL